MKLQKKVAQCNKNILNALPTFKFANDSSLRPMIKAQMLNAIQRRTETNIISDNVLILGCDESQNYEAAILIKNAFDQVGQIAQIINADNFLSMPSQARRARDIYYIIYGDFDNCKFKLADILPFISTQILFKLPGLDWKYIQGGKVDVVISNVMQIMLKILQIDTQNTIGIRLLAALASKEFCVVTKGKICKRVL